MFDAWKFSFVTVFVSASLCCVSGLSIAQDNADTTIADTTSQQQIEPEEMMPEEMMKVLKDFRKLTEQHKGLQFLVGEYDTVSYDYALDPENPVKETGTSKIEPVMGGRYIRQRYSSTWGGTPYKGEGINGFDKGTGKYFATWIDNYSTGILVTEGRYDQATHTMTEVGTTAGPLGPMTMKLVTAPAEAPAKFTMTMYNVLPDGSDMKVMKIIYTPKAKAE